MANSKNRRRSNIHYLDRDQDRRIIYQERDPEVELLASFIHQSGMTVGEITRAIYQASGHSWMPHYTTVENIIINKTKRPQNQTVNWIAHVCGYRRVWKKL